MSDELKLSDELAAYEAKLAAWPLAASGIDRDQLMYRAGWAAGAETARLAVVNSLPVKGAARGGITVAWSLTSAAVAASIAVMLTLQWRPNEPPAVVAVPADAHPHLAAELAEHRPSQLPRVESSHASLRSLSQGRISAGLLARHRQALTSVWAEPTNVASTAGDAAAPTAQTARELMQELLPAGSARETSDWPWIRTSPGDSI